MGVQKFVSALLILLATTFHTVAIVGVILWILVIRSNSEKEEYSCFIASKMLKNTIWIAGLAFVAYVVIMAVANSVVFCRSWSDCIQKEKLNKNQRFIAIMLSRTIIFDVLSMYMKI